jgi:DNA polymerase-3 subunit alpha
MAMLTLEDLSGKADAVVFSETFERLAGVIKPDAMVFVTGSVDRRRDRPSIIVDQIIPIDEAIEQLTGALELRLGDACAGADFLQRLSEVLLRHRGQTPIQMQLRLPRHGGVKVTVQPDKQWFVKPSRRLVDELVGLLKEENLLLRPKVANGNGGNGRRFYSRPAPRQAPLISNGPNATPSPAVTRFD